MNDLHCIAEKASCDEAFRDQLLACPAQACLEAGYSLPEGVSLRVYQDSASKRHVVLNDMCQFTHIPEVAKIAERADADHVFRAHLQANPANAIFDELGMAIPSSMEIVILENGPTTIHMVLESVELDDLTLAHVAGGKASIGAPAASSGKGAPTPAKPKPPANNSIISPPGALYLPNRDQMMVEMAVMNAANKVKPPASASNGSTSATATGSGQAATPGFVLNGPE